jgi:hypothetical protein
MYKIARLPVEQGAKACFVRRNKEKRKEMEDHNFHRLLHQAEITMIIDHTTKARAYMITPTSLY